ncbi:hypothetical protein AB0D10_43850 [Kitasatospora sp. NPDC048545]
MRVVSLETQRSHLPLPVRHGHRSWLVPAALLAVRRPAGEAPR